jgi:hypothetical protein
LRLKNSSAGFATPHPGEKGSATSFWIFNLECPSIRGSFSQNELELGGANCDSSP